MLTIIYMFIYSQYHIHAGSASIQFNMLTKQGNGKTLNELLSS